MRCRSLLVPIALSAALCAAAPTAEAGIVNVQSALTTPAEEGLSGSFTASADYRTGNIDLLLLSAAPVARYRIGDHLLVGIVRGDFGKTGEPLSTFIKKTFEHVRYRYRFHPRMLSELFVQHELDDFRRLSTRALVGLGPKFDLIDRKKLTLDLGVAYMLEYERLSEESDPMVTDSGDDDIQHRASSYLTLRVELDDNLQVIETFYVQPRLTDAGDIRLLSDLSLSVKVKKWLAFTTTFSLSHDTETPQTVEETDTALKSGITVTF